MDDAATKLKDPFGIADLDHGTIDNVPPPTEEEKKTLAEIDELYFDAKEAHSSRRGLIDYCSYMLKGEVLIARMVNHEYLRTVVEGNPQRPRSADNKMRVANRAFIAKLIKIVPKVRVKPRTADRDDMIAAEIMDSILDFGWESQKFKLKYKRAVSWIPRAGMGVLQPVWNKDGGRVLAVCEKCQAAFPKGEDVNGISADPGDPCPACETEMQAAMMQAQMPAGMEGGQMQMPSGPMPQVPGVAASGEPPPAGTAQPVPQEQLGSGASGLAPVQPAGVPQAPILVEAREGELEARVNDARDFIPDPGAAHPEEMQYAFIKRVLPVSLVRRMFPDKWKLIQAEQNLYSDKFLATTYGAPLNQGRVEKKILRNHCELKEYYEVPSPRYKRGRIVYYACGRLLEQTENIPASLLGRLQFYLLRGDVDDGELWPEPIILQAEGLQRELDIFVTQLRQHRDLTINPPNLIPVNSGIDDKFLDRTPGKNVKYRPQAGDPRPMKTTPLPPETQAEVARIVASFFEKWGVTPHELGQASAGDSGRFAALLDTIAQSVVSAMLVEIYSEWLEFNRAWIVLAQRYMAPNRVWTIYGTDKTQLVTNSWGKANVKPGWDVYLVEEDSMSKNPALRLNQALDLLARAPFLFMDQQTQKYDEKKFRLVAGLHLESVAADTETAEHIYAKTLPDQVRAWVQGQAPQPQPRSFDDPWIAIEELRAWLQTSGRSEDVRLVQMVELLWQTYIQAVIPTQPGQMIDPMLAKLLPAQKLGQQPGTQPAAPNMAGPQGAPPSGQPSDSQEAGQKIAQADKQGEQLTRGSQPHEG